MLQMLIKGTREAAPQGPKASRGGPCDRRLRRSHTKAVWARSELSSLGRSSGHGSLHVVARASRLGPPAGGRHGHPTRPVALAGAWHPDPGMGSGASARGVGPRST